MLRAGKGCTHSTVWRQPTNADAALIIVDAGAGAWAVFETRAVALVRLRSVVASLAVCAVVDATVVELLQALPLGQRGFRG